MCSHYVRVYAPDMSTLVMTQASRLACCAQHFANADTDRRSPIRLLQCRLRMLAEAGFQLRMLAEAGSQLQG
jgi:hypothetical protein